MVQGSIPRDHTIISLQFYTMIGSKIYWVYCDYSLLEAPWSLLIYNFWISIEDHTVDDGLQDLFRYVKSLRYPKIID